MAVGNRPRAEGVIVVAVAYLLVRVFWLLSAAAGRAFDSAIIEATAKIVLWGCGVFPVALWLARKNDSSVAEAFGLGQGALKAAAFGLAATAPMIGALFLLPLKGFDLDLALGSGLLGPLAEELLFRGFLFGLLWRGAGWSIPASILISSVLFGFAHVPNADADLWRILQGPAQFDGLWTDGTQFYMIPASRIWWDFVQSRGLTILSTVVPLSAGGAVLAWIACRWGSLWPAVALHACMNLWWDTTRGEHAVPSLGTDLMSVAQLTSVALAIIITHRLCTTGTTGTTGARNALTLANEP